ncbi:MAG: hypothetical protein GF417_13645 [Candidatus Latescibacteria bacterium]|nr:hypothetical protein [bacterium]MBD3425473.1 hypothetical protein [Candidatus Latescibacterota bacterium]
MNCKILVCLVAGILVSSGCGDEPQLPSISAESGYGRIAVYGDTRTNHGDHRNVVAAIMRENPEVVFHTGDLVDNGLEEDQWVVFDDITGRLRERAEFFPAIGNHERNSRLYFDHFELPNNERWYSVEREGIDFIILDSCEGIEAGSRQYRWLENELQGGGSDFTAVLFHHPPYSTGPHGEDEMNLRETVVPLFEEHRVSAVFNGHDHIYERSFKGGVHYVVAGGGGAPLYEQERDSEYSQKFLSIHHYCMISAEGDSMVVTAIDTLGNVFDRFSVRAGR